MLKPTVLQDGNRMMRFVLSGVSVQAAAWLVGVVFVWMLCGCVPMGGQQNPQRQSPRIEVHDPAAHTEGPDSYSKSMGSRQGAGIGRNTSPSSNAGRSDDAGNTRPNNVGSQVSGRNTANNNTADGVSNYLYMPDHPLADNRGYVRITSPAAHNHEVSPPAAEPRMSERSYAGHLAERSYAGGDPYDISSRLQPTVTQSRSSDATNERVPDMALRPAVSNVTISEVSEDGVTPVVEAGENATAYSTSPPGQTQHNLGAGRPYTNPTATNRMPVRDSNALLSASDAGTGNRFQTDTRYDVSAVQTSNATPTIQQGEIAKPSLPPQVTSVARDTFSGLTGISRTIAELEKHLETHTNDGMAQLALRLLYSQEGREQMAMKPFGSDSDQEVDMQKLVRGVLLTTKINLAGNVEQVQLANEALAVLDEVRQDVADKADLRIPVLKICSEVKGYGRYKELPHNLLTTGQPQEVLVYCELENFKNKKNEEGMYYTDLHAEITLYDEAYRVIGQPLSEDVTDSPSYNKRRDFFLRGPFKLPTLSPGKYEIVVSIEDKIARKIARAKRYAFEVKGMNTN